MSICDQGLWLDNDCTGERMNVKRWLMDGIKVVNGWCS
jgi:UDP-N-acetylmuramyl tripeptide synthase